MAVTLLRHPTPDVARGLCYGRTDLPLAAQGSAEMEAILATLPRSPVIVTSPLQRCRRLAAHIAAAWGCEEQVSTDWQEMDFGSWEGVPWNDIPRAALDAWAADFHHYDGHGGESVAALETRIRRALATAPQGALIVTHMGCIKAAQAICGDPDGWNAKLAFGASVTVFP